MIRLAFFILATLLVGSAAVGLPQEGRPIADVLALIAAADEGATVVVPPGVYHGALVVDKPITLLGEGVVLDGDGIGDVVTLAAPGITFRGFTVRNSGHYIDQEATGMRVLFPGAVIEDNVLEEVLFGIDLRAASNSVLRRNTISGKDLNLGRRGDGIRLWESDNCVLEGNHLIDTRDAILWYSEGCLLKDNICERGRYGFHFMYSHNTQLLHNRIVDNSVGIYIMYSTGIVISENMLANNRGPSGYGIGLKDADDIEVSDNVIVGNRVGIYLDNSPFSMDSFGLMTRNVIGFNDMGMAYAPNVENNVLWDNAFIENTDQIGVLGRGDLTKNSFSKDGRGNYWTDYTGFDSDGDGIGDIPYESVSLFDSLMARESKLKLFVHSPAEQAIELTARALPGIRPEPKFTDPTPLMALPELSFDATPERSRLPMVLMGVLLLVCGGTVVFWLARPANLPARAA